MQQMKYIYLLKKTDKRMKHYVRVLLFVCVAVWSGMSFTSSYVQGDEWISHSTILVNIFYTKRYSQKNIMQW